MRYAFVLCCLLYSMATTAQDCSRLLHPYTTRTESIIIPVYIHTEGVCPDDTILLMAVRDEDKLYLTAMPSECRTPVCEYIIRKSRYRVTFADSSVYWYDEPYLTNYSSDELFIMLKGRVNTRSFHPKTYKAKNKDTYTDIALLEKMLRAPVKSIQVYNVTPRTEWEEKPYKPVFEPGSLLQFSKEGSTLLMQVLQCMQQ